VTTVLGVDGGGRKTYAIVADAFGDLRGAAASGPSNWEMVGIDGDREALAGAVEAALV
jgi:N-acetylglucosamine kinase-like BadF-type ATPase